nr:MAG TPA: hypothetical protein [Caudoviricetes sp.]
MSLCIARNRGETGCYHQRLQTSLVRILSLRSPPSS